MAINIDAVLGANEESGTFIVVGNCDICIQGLTSGSIKLQYKLTPTANLPAPEWKDFPLASWSTDTYESIFISEHGVQCKLVGVSNNAGVYVRLARYLNK